MKFGRLCPQQRHSFLNLLQYLTPPVVVCFHVGLFVMSLTVCTELDDDCCVRIKCPNGKLFVLLRE